MPIAATVDAYIAAAPPGAQQRLVELRALYRRVIPQAEECISYGLPTYRLPNGAGRLHFGLAGNQYAVYGQVPAVIADELRAVGLRPGRGTVHFPLAQPVPAELITRLLEAQIAAQAAERGR